MANLFDPLSGITDRITSEIYAIQDRLATQSLLMGLQGRRAYEERLSADQAMAAERRRRQRAAQAGSSGRRGTILTGPMGVSDIGITQGFKTLLGE
jgi:hypothetical protein